MQPHTKKYLDYFEIEYDEATGFCDPVECTIQGKFCTGWMHEVHHIDPRGMGGNPNKSREVIENYIGCCRNCHTGAEKGYISKQRLYDLQAAKMMRFLTEKINKIVETLLNRIKAYFRKYGTVHHGSKAEYYKISLMGQIFVFWNCWTGEICKLEGRDLFDKHNGFNGKLIMQYYDPNQQKVVSKPEDLKLLHDEIELIYNFNKN